MNMLKKLIGITGVFAASFLCVSCAVHQTHFMDEIVLSGLKDGVYEGKDTTPLCSVTVQTTVRNGAVTDITVLRSLSYPPAARAYRIIPQRIIGEQSLDVDGVTAATVSVNNIKRAVRNSLRQAVR